MRHGLEREPAINPKPDGFGLARRQPRDQIRDPALMARNFSNISPNFRRCGDFGFQLLKRHSAVFSPPQHVNAPVRHHTKEKGHNAIHAFVPLPIAVGLKQNSLDHVFSVFPALQSPERILNQPVLHVVDEILKLSNSLRPGTRGLPVPARFIDACQTGATRFNCFAPSHLARLSTGVTNGEDGKI